MSRFLVIYLLTVFLKPQVVHEDNECLIRALRSIGAKVPFGTSQGYWAQKDGNAMLEKIGKQLIAVNCPELEDVGRYIVHSQNHFMGLRVHVDEAVLYDGRAVISIEDAGILSTQLHDPRFFKLCSNDWEDYSDVQQCKKCGEAILGAQSSRTS